MPDPSAASLLPLPLTREEFIATLRDMELARAPFVREQVKLFAFALPRWCVYPDGRIEKLDDGFSAETREVLRKMDDLLAQVSKPYLDKLAAGYREERP